jgi:hypothetical protein
MTGLDSVAINACTCSPAAVQLLSQGLFPCAPSAPSLAVDIALLNFTRDLFVRLPPNVTSFTEALEDFLNAQAYPVELVRLRGFQLFALAHRYCNRELFADAFRPHSTRMRSCATQVTPTSRICWNKHVTRSRSLKSRCHSHRTPTLPHVNLKAHPSPRGQRSISEIVAHCVSAVKFVRALIGCTFSTVSGTASSSLISFLPH